MKKLILGLPFLGLLVGCAPGPEAEIRYIQQNTLEARIDQIMKNPNLTPEQKEKAILALIAQQRKKWVATDIYKKEQAKTIAGLLKKPPTPLKTPPKIMRILILPWVDKSGVLHSQEYVYVEVDKGKWILGEYLYKQPSIQTTLTPLNK